MRADQNRRDFLKWFLPGLSLICLLGNPHWSEAKETVASAKKPAAKAPLHKAPVAPKASTQLPAKPKPKDSGEYVAGTPEFLWKATGDHGTAYLVGTLHMVRGSFYPLPKEMETAFHQSDYLVLEIDLSKSDPSVMQKLVMSKGLYSGSETLSKHLTESSKKALSEYLAKIGQPAQAFDKMRPWLAALMITKSELQKMGFQPELGIDQHFLHEARATEKKVKGLETEEFQIGLLAGFPSDLQDEMLRLTLFEVKELKTVAEEMMAKWRAGDDKGMDLILTRDVRKHPELMPVQEKMLYDRNIEMTAKIEEMLKTGDTYFIAVGSGHMVGDRGIVELLKKKGYKVEQVKVGQALPAPIKKPAEPTAAPVQDAPKSEEPAARKDPDWIKP